MAATIEIDEQNGQSKSPALTHNIANTNMGSVDAANMDPIVHPIAPGENSCEKWQLIHVIDMGTSTQINNLKVWRTGTLGTGATHKTNATTSNYDGAATYTTPRTAISGVATNDMPTSAPGIANLGINGTLDGQLISGGYSDFIVHQIQTTPKATAGNTSTLNYQYDEIA